MKQLEEHLFVLLWFRWRIW